MLQCAFLVFFMQCGFALLEAGSIRHKNTCNILLKNGGLGRTVAGVRMLASGMCSLEHASPRRACSALARQRPARPAHCSSAAHAEPAHAEHTPSQVAVCALSWVLALSMPRPPVATPPEARVCMPPPAPPLSGRRVRELPGLVGCGLRLRHGTVRRQQLHRCARHVMPQLQHARLCGWHQE